MDVRLNSISINTGCGDDEAVLALAADKLVAIAVRLTDPAHAEACGQWFLEAGFGPCAPSGQRCFASLAEFKAWICSQHN